MRTIDVARATGIAVNTVRLYEEQGYLPPVPRAANGYRQFSQQHIEHTRLVCEAMGCTWLGGTIRQCLLEMLVAAAQGDFTSADRLHHQVATQLQQQKTRAESAIVILQRWLDGQANETVQPKADLTIGEVAAYLGVSTDIVRGWERNNLLTVPRAANGYRQYGSEEIERLLVIHSLRQARYSTMAILRMFHRLEQDDAENLRDALHTEDDDDNIVYATDHWLATLEDMIAATHQMADLLQTLQSLH